MNHGRSPRLAIRIARPLALVALALALAAPARAQDAPLSPTAAAAADPALALVCASAPFTVTPGALLAAGRAAEALSPTAAVVTLLVESRYVFDADGRATHTYRCIFRPRTRAAAEAWATMSDDWAPWHEDRPEIRARIVAPDGEVRELDARTVEDAPASDASEDVFTDARRVRAPLPAMGAGVVVEEEVVTRETAPLLPAGEVHRFWFFSRTPVARTRLIVDAPAARPLRIAARLLDDAPPGAASEGGRARTTFERGPTIPGAEPEANLPFDAPRWPSVGFTTGASWGEVATAYAALVDRQVAGAVTAAAIAREAAAGASAPREVAARVLARVFRDVRYTGVEFGDASIVPRPPGDVLARGYGDCKDQAALVVTMLRAAGVPAQVALLEAGFGPDVDPALPGLGAFNHAIVFVPGADPFWIDPTDHSARAGELPTGDQGRLALVAVEGTSALAKTPEAGAAENVALETREVLLAEDGPAARLSEVDEARGAPERGLRGDFAGDRARVREALEAYAKGAYDAPTATAAEATPADDLAAPYRLRVEVTGAKIGETTRSRASASVAASDVLQRLPRAIRTFAKDDRGEPIPEPARVGDYLVPEPYAYEIRWRVTPPPGYAPLALPEAPAIDLGPAARLTRALAAEGATLTATFRFEMLKRRLSPAEYGALRAGLRTFLEGQRLRLAFEHVGRAHLAAGRVKEALVEMRRLVALHPDEALHRIDVAEALLEAGLGEAARDEARRATELDPRSAPAARELAWTLAHDPIGRIYGKGFDLDGAAAAYERMKALDPREYGRFDYALLLERNASGERYGKGARLSQAAAEIDGAREALKDKRFDEQAVADLVFDRRFEDARKRARDLPQTRRRDVLRLDATAALDGAKAAVAEAATLLDDAAARREVLTASARDLVALRLYPEAVALVEEAARGASNASALEQWATQLRKVRRFEDTPLPDAEPASAVRRFVYVSAVEEETEKLFPLLAKTYVASLDAGGLAALKAATAAGSARAGRPEGFSVEGLVETGLSVATTSVDGDDAAGYRVRMKTAAAAMPTIYVVREEAGYRVAALDTAPSSLGTEALRRADAGDLAGARRWLDWARETTARGSADDPLAGPPFAALWTRGKAGDADAVRAAAAALIAGASPRRALPILEAARAGAVGEAARLRLDAALLDADVGAKDWPAAASVAARILESEPDSERALHMEVMALVEAKRYAEAGALAAKRLAAKPDDPLGLRLVARVAERAGDSKECERCLRRLIALGEADALDQNQLSWDRLVLGVADESDVEVARAAVDGTRGARAPELHTLASIYAELGRTAEAREAILKAMAAAGSLAPEPHDWYVFGRIAEDYGERDAAIPLYRRALPDDDAELGPFSTESLARRRLEALGAPRRVVR